MKLFTLSLFFGCALLIHGKPQPAGLCETYWPNADNIVVCWETPGFALEKTIVQQAIRRSWEAHSILRFTNWTDCQAGTKADIRIQVGEFHPHTSGLGTQLRNVAGGMKLNFRFEAPEFRKSFSKCRRRRAMAMCIRAIAVHEFGHAIGLTHEQNRRDAPAGCRRRQNGTEPNHLITVYDPLSVMNYCSKRIRLSPADIRAVKLLYARNEGECRLFQNQDFTCDNPILKSSYAADQCCELCTQDSNCKVFKWDTTNNGTCYLMSDVNEMVEKCGAISGRVKSRTIWRL